MKFQVAIKSSSDFSQGPNIYKLYLHHSLVVLVALARMGTLLPVKGNNSYQNV